MGIDKTILLVEDEEAIRKALKPRFEEEGYTVLEASDGVQALVLAKESRPDIILLDVIMPKMHGIDMLDQLQAQEYGRRIQVMLLTNYADDPKVVRAVEEKRCEIMDKTKFHLDDVVVRVGELLEQKSH